MKKQESILIAFGSVPKDGGTYTFYRNIRPELKKYGIDLRCVSVGRQEAELWDVAFADDGCVLLAGDEPDVKRQAMAFAEWCKKNDVNIVMGINSFAILSALPHLPETIRVISRCANAFDHGYKITLSGSGRLARIIATTPRLKDDLVNLYGADPGKIEMIPNGISPNSFNSIESRPKGNAKKLSLGFVGRLEHNQKGVLYLPYIIRGLDKRDVDFIFRIAGTGVHKRFLERELKSYVADGRVRFEGPLTPASIIDFLGQTDVFVFVSRFEGCPNALLEAMMAGCVPVVYLIEGITDFIVDDGNTGFVCPMEDAEAFSERVAALDRDRKRLQKMSAAGVADARRRFSNERAAADYARVFQEVMQAPSPEWTPLPWSAFRPDPAFNNPTGWKSFIPESLKRTIKNCLFYAGLSDRYYE